MNTLASVLLIEDNPGDARLVREHLSERLGDQCRLHAVETLGTGLQWLATKTADVILLDLSLPDSEGLATYLKVLECAPRTPVVILSGHDDDELARDAVRAGAQDYLAKQHADGVMLARTLRHAVERRHAEQALRESESRYRSIVETAEEGILQLDAAGRIHFVNARMARMIGRAVDDLLGNEFLALVEPSYRPLAQHLLNNCASGSQRSTGELRFQRADGSLLWTLLAAGSVAVLGSDRRDTVVMLSDITGRVLAEQELVRIARELEQRVAQRTAQLEAANADLALFNHSIAHDLRTPLNAVLGFTTLLERDAARSLSLTQQRHLHFVQEGARDMDQLLDGLLALSQVGRAEVRREPLDLSALAAAAVEQLRRSQPGRTVEVEITAGLQVSGDPALVRSLLDNLLGNAWKYTARVQRPWLRFGLAEAESSAAGAPVFVVQDNGVGFDMGTAARLFQPFERLASGEDFAGTGIGLTSAKRIAERHGGRIWAESVPGEGTSFFFTLGAAAPAGA